MNYSFELRKDKINKNGLMPVRIVVTANKIKIRKNLTSVKTLLEDWDNTNGYIRNNKKNPHYNDYIISNNEIQNTKEKVEKIFSFFQFNTIQFSEKVFLEKYDKADFSVAVNFYDSYDDFVRVSKHTKSEGTVRKYTTLKNFLIHFSENTNYPIRFDTINLQFEEEFMRYAFEQRKTLNNYYGKLISVLKAFMNWSFNRGLHQNIEFNKIKKIENEIEVIYLEKDELLKLYKHDFKDDLLNRVKDFFCFGCFTGLRHSDINNMHKANINEEFIQLNIIKTKTVSHRVELNKYSKAILDKYSTTIYKPLPRISSKKLNENIKICCEKIGIVDDVTITRYIGTKRIELTFKKYELITCHISRKTFVTNSLIFGMNERVLREITNHSTERAFKKYLKIPNSLKNREMNKTWNENF